MRFASKLHKKKLIFPLKQQQFLQTVISCA